MMRIYPFDFLVPQRIIQNASLKYVKVRQELIGIILGYLLKPPPETLRCGKDIPVIRRQSLHRG